MLSQNFRICARSVIDRSRRVGPQARTFHQTEAAYGNASILATNTSSSIDEVPALAHKDRFIAIHYMQPAEAFPLVEVCRLEETSDETTKKCVEALARSGKESIVLQRPIIGFLINRLQRYCTKPTAWSRIELFPSKTWTSLHAVVWSANVRYRVDQQKDLSGVDVNAAAQRSIVLTSITPARPVRWSGYGSVATTGQDWQRILRLERRDVDAIAKRHPTNSAGYGLRFRSKINDAIFGFADIKSLHHAKSAVPATLSDREHSQQYVIRPNFGIGSRIVNMDTCVSGISGYLPVSWRSSI